MTRWRTTRGTLSCNRWWTRSQVDSSAHKIQSFSRTSPTCSSNMTGEQLSCLVVDFDLVFRVFEFRLSDLTDLFSLCLPLQVQSICRLWRLYGMSREGQPALSGNASDGRGSSCIHKLSCSLFVVLSFPLSLIETLSVTEAAVSLNVLSFS